MKTSAQQYAWVSGVTGKQVKHEKSLSGFEVLAKDIPQSDWMSTPALVEYVKANFETRYCPEQMISALGLRFSDPELNDTVAEKQSKLLDNLAEETTPEEELPAA
jgi:hypothetical protein